MPNAVRPSLLALITLALLVTPLAVHATTPQADAEATAAADQEEGTADASTSAEAGDASEEDEGFKLPYGLGFTIVLDQAVGIGTFVSGSQRRAQYDLAFDLRPSWKITDQHVITSRFALTQTLVTNADSGTTRKRDLLPSDTELRYTYRNAYVIPGVNVAMHPYLSVMLPSSKNSRFQKLILAVRPAISLSWKKDWLSVGFTSRVTKNFHRYTQPTINQDNGAAVARLRGNEDVGGGFIATGGRNSEWSLFNDINVSFALPLDLNLLVDFYHLVSWTYDDTPTDDRTAENADSGRGVSDVVAGTVELGWQTPVKPLSLALGATTAQTPKTPDNKSFRFPFFDFTSPSNNLTAIYFDVIASF